VNAVLSRAHLRLNFAQHRARAALAASFRRPLHKPVKIKFQISTVCNLKCLHCGIWKRRRNPQALTLQEWLRLVDELYAWMGPFSLGFVSGEPLIEKSLFPIIRKASGLGIQTHCVSNGTLIDEAMARRIASSGLKHLALSLDGFRAGTHDRSRGVAGTFAKVRTALRRLKAAGPTPALYLSTIIAGHNLSELEDLVFWAASEGLAAISFQPLEPDGDQWESLWPKDIPQACEAIERLIRLKRLGYPIENSETQLRAMQRYYMDSSAPYPDLLCGTYRRLWIRDDGFVYMCNHKEPIGNVRSQGFPAIWHSAASRSRLREILDCKKPCILQNCYYQPRMREQALDWWRLAAGGGTR